MRFGEIFDKSWKEYKINFKEFFKFVLVFTGIPALLFLIVQIVWMFLDSSLMEVLRNPMLIYNGLALPVGFLIFTGISGLISVLLYIFVGAGVVKASLEKRKFKFKNLVDLGKKFFGKYLAFCIVFGIFIMLLFMLLIIPGVIFLVYWGFAIYIFFSEKVGIMGSLKKSRKIVKGNWWRVFGYGLLLIILVALVSAVFDFPSQLVVSFFGALAGESYPVWTIIFSGFWQVLSEIVSMLLGVFMILFFKNFYLDLKGKKK